QNKEPEKFFGLIEDNLKQVHPIFQTVFKTFLKDTYFILSRPSPKNCYNTITNTSALHFKF
ncbi:hypothetical protein, partial [Streptococcus pneumoniae]|uniref:hypothetical protein n=1 Tax=Streptococcus pneumoniae TaxID=1313 RepID=UPI001D17793E